MGCTETNSGKRSGKALDRFLFKALAPPLAEVLYQHEVHVRTVLLGVQNPSPVRRYAQSLWIRPGLKRLTEYRNLCYRALRKTEELNRGTITLFACHKVNSVRNHGPGAPVSRSVRVQHECFLATRDWSTPDPGQIASFRVVQKLTIHRLECLGTATLGDLKGRATI